jgi:hypothetical protein
MATGLLSFKPLDQFNQGQVDSSTNAYNQANTAYQGAQNQQQDFTKNMQSGSDMYAQNQQAGNQWAGYDPARLQTALKTVQQTQNVIAGLPQTVNAQGSNYGATAGNLAGQYSGMMNNLNPALAAQTNNVAQNQATQAAAGNYAQSATSAGVQVQQQKLTGLQNLTQNALAQMDQARQVMQNYQTLYQSQGQFNSDEQAKYAQANAAYMQAQAAANLASTQAQQIQQSIRLTQAAADAAAKQSTPAAIAQSNAVKGSQSFLNSQGANGKNWTSQDASNLANYQTAPSWVDTIQHGSLLNGLGAAFNQVINHNGLWG